MTTENTNNDNADATPGDNDTNNNADTNNADDQTPADAELARLAADAARVELDGMKSDLFAKLDTLAARIDEMVKPVPVTDPRKPNNAPPSTDYAELSPAARIAAGYK